MLISDHCLLFVIETSTVTRQSNVIIHQPNAIHTLVQWNIVPPCMRICLLLPQLPQKTQPSHVNLRKSYTFVRRIRFARQFLTIRANKIRPLHARITAD